MVLTLSSVRSGLHHRLLNGLDKAIKKKIVALIKRIFSFKRNPNSKPDLHTAHCFNSDSMILIR